jgi:hypothetical protein
MVPVTALPFTTCFPGLRLGSEPSRPAVVFKEDSMNKYLSIGCLVMVIALFLPSPFAPPVKAASNLSAWTPYRLTEHGPPMAHGHLAA